MKQQIFIFFSYAVLYITVCPFKRLYVFFFVTLLCLQYFNNPVILREDFFIISALKMSVVCWYLFCEYLQTISVPLPKQQPHPPRSQIVIKTSVLHIFDSCLIQCIPSQDRFSGLIRFPGKSSQEIHPKIVPLTC